jgi:hypothetical protein
MISADSLNRIVMEALRVNGGEVPRFVFHEDPREGLCIVCERCGFVPVGHDFVRARSIPECIRALCRAHEHPKPKALTPEQRERARLVGIRRQGALRCGYGSAA